MFKKCLKNNSAILIYIAALSYPIIVVICFSYKTDAFQAYMIFVFLPLNFNSNLHDHFDIIAYIVPLRTLFVVNKNICSLNLQNRKQLPNPYQFIYSSSFFQFCSTSLFPSLGVSISKKKTYFF